jgi:hypothetical protein
MQCSFHCSFHLGLEAMTGGGWLLAARSQRC